ncbi:MAG: TVP38/TMEM64 family protein [Hyphomicrobiaceae bacterium]
MPKITSEPAPSSGRPSRMKRWMPLAAILVAAALAYAFRLHDYASFRMIGLHYAFLQHFISENLVLALAIYFIGYAGIVALSVPCALVMTLAGGLLFGWMICVPVTVVGATAGATVLFLVARSSIGETLASRAGPAAQSLRAGFQENAFSYMLFLRLVPIFPFVVVNIAAAALGVPLRTFFFGTLLGIIPGTTAYSVAGSGLGSVIEAQNAHFQACVEKVGTEASGACPYTIDTSALITKELVLAFVLLGIVALIPVSLKKWKARNATV